MILLGLALAAEPAGVVRAAVVVTGEQVDDQVLMRTRADTTELLENSGRYQVLSPELAEGRLGYAPEELSCASAECWTEAAGLLGADQVVVLHLTADWVGPRTEVMVVDVASSQLREAPAMNLPRQGGAPIESLELLLLGDGRLTLSWPIPEAVLILDGERHEGLGGGFSESLPAGKHLLRVEAEGYAPLFAAVLVVPGQDQHLALDQHPTVAAYTRRNWGPWAALAVVGGGAAALAATASVPGVAW